MCPYIERKTTLNIWTIPVYYPYITIILQLEVGQQKFKKGVKTSPVMEVQNQLVFHVVEALSPLEHAL